jgi:hypothetical protein
MPSLGKLIRRWNRAARRSGLLGDLSIPGWLATLEHFEYRCAYCGGPYGSMDHFIPQFLRGPMGMDNCLPSCWSCNDRKASAHPDRCGWIAKDRLARIHAYLDPLVVEASQRRQQEASRQRDVQMVSVILHRLAQYCQTHGKLEGDARGKRYQEVADQVGSHAWLFRVFSIQDVQDRLYQVSLWQDDPETLAVYQDIERELLRLCAEAALPAPKHPDPAIPSVL